MSIKGDAGLGVLVQIFKKSVPKYIYYIRAYFLRMRCLVKFHARARARAHTHTHTHTHTNTHKLTHTHTWYNSTLFLSASRNSPMELPVKRPNKEQKRPTLPHTIPRSS